MFLFSIKLLHVCMDACIWQTILDKCMHVHTCLFVLCKMPIKRCQPRYKAMSVHIATVTRLVYNSCFIIENMYTFLTIYKYTYIVHNML